MFKRIIWFVSTVEDVNFLKAFRQCYPGDIDVVHLNFITRIALRSFEGKHFVPYKKYKQCGVSEAVDKTFNVLSGRLSLAQAQKAFKNTYGMLEFIEPVVADTLFVIPSGRHVHHVAATRYAKDKGIKRIYINYSNFPGYTFFDPEGTDCLSSIYADPSILDRLYPEAVDVVTTFKKFSDLKRQQLAIPQASKSKWKERIKSVAFILDTVLQVTLGMVGDRRVSFKSLKSDKSMPFEYDEASLSERFMFFPMQVSTDQQVLVNYDGGSVIAAVHQALKLAEDNNALLYVREHPAEGSKTLIRSELDCIRKKNSRLKIVTNSVAELMDNSISVVTINSTVGLECRINGKPVVFLGRSFYEKATDEQLAKYLGCYLVDVDYHDPDIKEKLSFLMLAKCV